MNLRHKSIDFRELAGLKKTRRDSYTRIEHDSKLDMNVSVSLIRDDLNLDGRVVNVSDKHEVSALPQYIIEENHNPGLGILDPKLRVPCKVHLVRLSQPSCTNEEVICRSVSKFNMLCKVIVNQNDLAATYGSKGRRNVQLKQNRVLKPADQCTETHPVLPSTDSNGIKATSHNVLSYVTNESVTETNECRVDKISNGRDKRMSVDTLCHAVCDHAVLDKTNVGFNCDSNKEVEPKQKPNTTTEVKRRKIIALRDHNEIVPRKRQAKKKIASTATSENIPEVVVEKCTDRIPVYKKLDENLRNSLNRKSNPYEFTERDPDPGDIKKPKKRRRKVGVKNKKTTNVNIIYNKCIKQIMNKLAITVQSNKFVTREIEKPPKNRAVLPTKIVRIQTKRPKVKFKDVLAQPVTDKEINQVQNVHKIQVNNINTNNIMPLDIADPSESNLPSQNIAKLDDNNKIRIDPEVDELKHGKEDTKQINQNGNVICRGVHRKYENKRNMNPRRLFCEPHQPPSPKVTAHDSDNSNDMFDFYHDDCNPPTSKSPIQQDEQNHANSKDQHLKIHELLDDDDPHMSFASQISINRCASACSESVDENHRVSPREIADDDPYFGFGTENDNIVQPSPELANNMPAMNKQKRLSALEMTRKTDSPWRYSPRNILFNPHFVRLKPNALPVISQDPVLDSTFDENIKKHHPELKTVERTEEPRQKSPVQKSILNYITSDVHTNKENTKRLSMFDNEEFSPIKLSNMSSARLAPNKAKRNILGALSSNIIVHSVIAISTPQKDKLSDHMESPDLSVILERPQDNLKTIKPDMTRLQALNSEVEITSNINDGFSVDLEASSKLGNVLKEHEKTSTEQQVQEQTFFGFESITECENINVKKNEKVSNEQDKNNDAKPFRLSLNVKKNQRKMVKFEDDEVHVNGKPKAQSDSSDSEDDFIPPTPNPENESLKVGLFEEVESKKSNKTYRSRKRYREYMAPNSEDEEDGERHRKKKKDQPTKAEVEEFNKWAAQFNAMCDEVEQFPLEID